MSSRMMRLTRGGLLAERVSAHVLNDPLRPLAPDSAHGVVRIKKDGGRLMASRVCEGQIGERSNDELVTDSHQVGSCSIDVNLLAHGFSL